MDKNWSKLLISSKCQHTVNMLRGFVVGVHGRNPGDYSFLNMAATSKMSPINMNHWCLCWWGSIFFSGYTQLHCCNIKKLLWIYLTLLIFAGNGRGGESIYGGYFEGIWNIKLSNNLIIVMHICTKKKQKQSMHIKLHRWLMGFCVRIVLCLTALTFTFPLCSSSM